MPDLALSMPAHNAARYIKKAIAGILAQTDVELELIVIDDGSTDETATVVQSFQDSRLIFIKNEQRKGPTYCHNLALARSCSPFIVHVNAVDVVLPGALQKLLAACKASPRVGLVHCYSFEIDEYGKALKAGIRRRKEYLQQKFGPEFDYKQELVRSQFIIDGFRMYRREALQEVGNFDETLKSHANYDIALKIADRYDIVLVPEFLHCQRKLAKLPKRKLSRGWKLAEWLGRYRLIQRLRKSHTVRFLRDGSYTVNALLLQSLWDALNPLDLKHVLAVIQRPFRQLFQTLWSRTRDRLYYSVIIHLSRWPIGLFRPRKQQQTIRDKKVAYYNWHFPVLSQTFIHRELAALCKSGLAVVIIADEAEDTEIADDNAKSLLNRASYLYPLHAERLRRYRRFFFLRSPLTYLNLFFFVMTRQYGVFKSLAEDQRIFAKAIYLAGVLQEQQVNHIHSPWADLSAFVALLAARLLKIPYSVQARAHDIHRETYLYALREKFENGEFVVTNTRYNQAYINDLLQERNGSKVRLIHNGIDLERFVPASASDVRTTATRLLCVARLIEQKGLIYLLKACRILLDKGHELTCEIIGAPEEPLYTNYFIALKKLRRQLALEEHVIFTGALPFEKVLAKYRTADLFVLPCVIAADGSRDITPNALIEAMAMKLPVVSTTVTGIPEIVEDGVSGILIAPHDEQALADAVIKLIQDPDLRKRLGESARKRVEEKFDINKNVAHYLELFTRDCKPEPTVGALEEMA
jgi:glycosyltransferase involved in cell wall biosynthesis